MAAGEEAVDEEEARLERFTPAARQPAARRHLRFLQELRGGDTGEDREERDERSLSVTRSPWVTTSCSVRANGAVALADDVSYHQTKCPRCYMRARRRPRWPASTRGNQQEG